MRCPECGVETGGPGPFCPVCGTYLATPPPLTADSVDGAPLGRQDDDDQSARDKRTALKFGFGLLVVLLAIGGPVAASHSSWAHHSSSRQLSYTQLSVGDCLVGSDLGLANDNPWPAEVTAVPCTHRHLAEIFFAGNLWPQSLAYPGYNAISHQGYARCLSAFLAYDGIAQPASAFSISYTAPDAATWPTGDRHVVCAAYRPYLGAANGVQPVTHSIKGSRR